jgi:hypothetical protein
VLTLVLSAIWWSVEGGYEPFIASITGLAAIVALQIEKFKDKKGERTHSTHKLKEATQVHTGDQVIDRVIEKLQELERKAKPIPESQLTEALKPLFTRPAFYGIREENWNYFLYPLIRTRLLIEQYADQFRNTPEVRRKLGQIAQLMTKLQNDVAYIYGNYFSVTEHFHRYGVNKDEFLTNLPPIVMEPDYRFFNDRDKTIREIRDILKSIHFVDW